MKLYSSLLFLSLAMVGIGAQAQNYAFTPLDVTVEQGSQAQLSISMTNNELAVISAQFDLILPDGITVAKNAKGAPICSLVESRIDDHIVQAAVQADGAVRYLTYSPTNLTYKGTDGPLVTTLLDINLEPGTYTVNLVNGSMTHEGDYVEYNTPEASATITVTAPEIKRYGDNQMYVKDVTVNQGENATLLVGYNVTSDLFGYRADIQLPVGVSVESVEFGDAVKVTNYKNDWNVNGNTLTLSGEYGGGRKDVPADPGDFIFATVGLMTSAIAAGEYDIIVDNQYLDTDDGEVSPESYEAYLKVIAPNSDLKPCATPVIAFDSEGNLVVTSATKGAKMHTTINAVDHGTVHHANDEMIPLTGQYLISAYASADDMADSAPSNAVLVWAKAADIPSGVNNITAGTERALIIRSANDSIEIVGTVKGENVALYTILGTTLYEGLASADITTIPIDLNSGEVYIITVGTQSFKYKF